MIIYLAMVKVTTVRKEEGVSEEGFLAIVEKTSKASYNERIDPVKRVLRINGGDWDEYEGRREVLCRI